MAMEQINNDNNIAAHNAFSGKIPNPTVDSMETGDKISQEYVEWKDSDSRSDKDYSLSGFPQPYTAGFGTTLGNTSTNQINTGRAYAPNNWSITRTGVGVLTFNHNLGTLEAYLDMIPFAPALSVYITSQTPNAFFLQLYDRTGTAVDAVVQYNLSALP